MGAKQRKASVPACGCPTCKQHPHAKTARQHRLIIRLVSFADERLRRQLAGFFAQQHGRGGLALLAQITGLSQPTIRRGMRELKRSPRLAPRRLRHPGAGPKPVEVANPKSLRPWKSCSLTPPLATPSVA